MFPRYPANVTWTIPVEYAASNLIYLLAFVITHLGNRRYLLYGLLIFYLWWTVSLHCLFLIGLLVNDLDQNKYIQGWIDKLDNIQANMINLLLVTGILLLSYQANSTWIDTHAASLQCYDIFGEKPEDINILYNTNRLHTSRLISGTALFLLASYSFRFRSFLNSYWVVYLGKISFGLYLCHDMVAQIFVSRVLVYSIHTLGYSFELAAWICVGVYYLALIPFSYLFWRFIDEPSVRASHWIFERVFNQNSQQPQPQPHTPHPGLPLEPTNLKPEEGDSKDDIKMDIKV